MPGEASTVGANFALDAITRRVAGPAAATMHLALLTAAPTDGTTLGTMAEVTTAGYARQPVGWTAPSGDPSSSSNSAQLTFGPFTADPPNVTHCALVSPASGTTGDFLFHWALDVAKDAAVNESITFAVGALVARVD